MGSRKNRGWKVWHNDWFVDAVNLPGGGYKKSGYGRDGGIDSLYSYGQTSVK